MNKKKILLSAAATSMIAISGAVLAINGGLKSSSVFATNGEVWYHYAEIAPTSTRHGSKEFWASSIDGCTTHQFVNPGVTSIDRNFLDNEYFYSLTKEDDRYIAPTSSSPIINGGGETGDTVTYGIYPRTVIMDEELVSNLNKDAKEQTNGWFLYRGEYYAKVSAKPYNYDLIFDNGTTIVWGTTYWFKCEPISWTILTNDYVDADGNHLGYYLLSDVLLDVHRYNEQYSGTKDGHYENNYQYSEIRSWLNNDFYKSAFALGKSHIQTTTVDNSASTTDSSMNSYICDNTKDEVFLPSYKDYINSDYGFLTSANSSDTSRYCRTTDWARARGADFNTDSGNGDYWTRSPYSDGGMWSVGNSGYVNGFYHFVDEASVSVRPALSIKIA